MAGTERRSRRRRVRSRRTLGGPTERPPKFSLSQTFKFLDSGLRTRTQTLSSSGRVLSVHSNENPVQMNSLHRRRRRIFRLPLPVTPQFHCCSESLAAPPLQRRLRRPPATLKPPLWHFPSSPSPVTRPTKFQPSSSSPPTTRRPHSPPSLVLVSLLHTTSCRRAPRRLPLHHRLTLIFCLFNASLAVLVAGQQLRRPQSPRCLCILRLQEATQRRRHPPELKRSRRRCSGSRKPGSSSALSSLIHSSSWSAVFSGTTSQADSAAYHQAHPCCTLVSPRESSASRQRISITFGARAPPSSCVRVRVYGSYVQLARDYLLPPFQHVFSYT